MKPRRSDQAKRHWCVYFSDPGARHDRLVDLAPSEEDARAAAARLNAALETPSATPFAFYYACHGVARTAIPPSIESHLDALAEAFGED